MYQSEMSLDPVNTLAKMCCIAKLHITH